MRTRTLCIFGTVKPYYMPYYNSLVLTAFCVLLLMTPRLALPSTPRVRRACYRRNRSTLPQPRSHGSPLGASLRQPLAQPDDRPVAIWQAWTPQLPPLPAPPGHACSWLQLNYTVHAGSADGSSWNPSISQNPPIRKISAANPAFANLPFKHPVEPLQCCFAAFGSSSDASAPSHENTRTC